MDDTKVVTQYRVHIELPGQSPMVCQLVGGNLELLRERTHFLLNRWLSDGEAKFSAAGQSELTLIYHTKFDHGRTALGWVARYAVPSHASVEAAIERLEEETARAA